MTPMTDLERRLTSWLDEDGPSRVRPGVVDAALARASAERQRHPWLVREWWQPRHPRLEWPEADDEAVAADLDVGVPALPLLRPRARLAWVLVALLALLALVGGLLGVGGWLRADSVTGFTCPGGSDPDVPGPADQARPDVRLMIAEWAGNGRIATLTGTSAPWTFDVCTNTWQAPPGTGALSAGPWPDSPGPQLGTLAYDDAAGLLVAFGGTGIDVFERDGRWSHRDGGPTPAGAQVGYDPATGLFIVRQIGGRQMWTYDLDTNEWLDIVQRPEARPTSSSSGFQLATYDPAAGRFVLVDGSRVYKTTWLFDPTTSTWTESRRVVPFSLFIQTDEIAYDATAGRTLVYAEGRVLAYDAAADAPWEVLFEAGPTSRRYDRSAPGVAYDRVNDRLVVFGGRIRDPDSPEGWSETDDVIAFDPVSRTWTELLAPSAGGTP